MVHGLGAAAPAGLQQGLGLLLRGGKAPGQPLRPALAQGTLGHMFCDGVIVALPCAQKPNSATAAWTLQWAGGRQCCRCGFAGRGGGAAGRSSHSCQGDQAAGEEGRVAGVSDGRDDTEAAAAARGATIARWLLMPTGLRAARPGAGAITSGTAAGSQRHGPAAAVKLHSLTLASDLFGWRAGELLLLLKCHMMIWHCRCCGRQRECQRGGAVPSSCDFSRSRSRSRSSPHSVRGSIGEPAVGLARWKTPPPSGTQVPLPPTQSASTPSSFSFSLFNNLHLCAWGAHNSSLATT